MKGQNRPGPRNQGDEKREEDSPIAGGGEKDRVRIRDSGWEAQARLRSPGAALAETTDPGFSTRLPKTGGWQGLSNLVS